MMANLRQEYVKRLAALKNERSTWIDHYRDLGDYILPRRFRYLTTDTNRGTKRNDKIVNNTPTRASRVLQSGMMAGITSPARPWFRLTVPDPELAEHQPVRSWLHHVEEIIRETFAKSNIYNALPILYGDLGVFGTSPLYLEEDPEDIVRAYVIPVGQYMLANSARLQVDTIFREFKMTVGQVVEQFAIKSCSGPVRMAYEQGHLDQWVDVVHAVEPRKSREYGKVDGKNKPWKSCWFESGKSTDSHWDGLLREWGYDEFPFMCPRWNVTGEDVYGHSPGMDALGDVKALQLYEKRKAQAADKIVNPPMVGPTSLRSHRASLLPGDITYSDSAANGEKFRPAYEIQAQSIAVIGEQIMRHEERINSAFFADLWLLLANSQGTMTAREVAERHEEKMLQLGPVLERLHDELLDPLIDRTFNILSGRGMLPPPPEELEGLDLKVEYLSIMAQAQKLIGTSSVERFLSFVGSIAASKPDVLDKVDADKVVDEYARMTSINPDMVRSEDVVAQIRAERAEQQQAQAQAQAMMQAAQGAETLSKTDMAGDSALTRLLGGLGVAAPTGVVQ